jgi:bifunctional non-homologous end joining protein LigD
MATRKRTSVPRFIVPMAAKLTRELRASGMWLYELKFDGYRALIIKDGDSIEVRSRNDKDLTGMFPSIAAAGAKISAKQAVVDGEIVAMGHDGKPSFQALQHRGRYPDHVIAYFAFDLLHLEGTDLMDRPLRTRRKALENILLDDAGLLFSKELPGSAVAIVQAVATFGLEGVVAKRRDSLYEPGERSGYWLKYRIDQQQEFVVGGYEPGTHGVGALLVGYYEGKTLRFTGKVKAGFVRHTRQELLEPPHVRVVEAA